MVSSTRALAVGLSGLLGGLGVAGCSQGSGTPFVVQPQTTAAPVTAAQGQPVALGFTSTDLGGEVQALGAAPDGTVLAGRDLEVLRVAPGASPEAEVALGGAPTSFASVGSQVYMGVGSEAGGALLVRDTQDDQVAWIPVLETDAHSVSVASVGSVAIVLTGGGPYDGEVLKLGADGSMVSLASFPVTRPTDAVGFQGALYVAGVGPLSGGVAAARFGRLDPQGQLTTFALPVNTARPGGVEQRVAGFGVRATAAGQELMIVVGEHDAVTGEGLGGFAATSDGVSVQVVAEFDHEPRSATFVDAQPYVGLADGRLLTSSEGAWREVTGLPATLGIERLLAVDATLWVVARGPSGARLFVQAPPVDEFKDLPRGFVGGIHELLVSSCVPCHSDPSRTFRVGVDPAADLASSRSFVDPGAPETSSLFTKAVGSTSHGGGAIFAPADPRAQDLQAWIEQGAPEEAGPVNYTQHVAPIFAAVNCVRCHDLKSQRPYLLSTSGDLDADYRITVAYVDVDDPETSELLLRTSATLPHPAQGIPNPSRRREVVLEWIADGMLRGPDPGE